MDPITLSLLTLAGSGVFGAITGHLASKSNNKETLARFGGEISAKATTAAVATASDLVNKRFEVEVVPAVKAMQTQCGQFITVLERDKVDIQTLLTQARNEAKAAKDGVSRVEAISGNLETLIGRLDERAVRCEEAERRAKQAEARFAATNEVADKVLNRLEGRDVEMRTLLDNGKLVVDSVKVATTQVADARNDVTKTTARADQVLAKVEDVSRLAENLITRLSTVATPPPPPAPPATEKPKRKKVRNTNEPVEELMPEETIEPATEPVPA